MQDEGRRLAEDSRDDRLPRGSEQIGSRVTPHERPHDGGDVMSNPLVELQQHGQSVWLDYIRRKSLLSGDFKKLIAEDGLRGMTANPSIFQAAIAAGDDYDETIEREVRAGAEPMAIYETLAVEDIQAACDQFRSVYDSTDGLDGYVSLEVAPGLARDTQGTIAEARRLWKWVDRPNLMIKVPGLKE